MNKTEPERLARLEQGFIDQDRRLSGIEDTQTEIVKLLSNHIPHQIADVKSSLTEQIRSVLAYAQGVEANVKEIQAKTKVWGVFIGAAWSIVLIILAKVVK